MNLELPTNQETKLDSNYPLSAGIVHNLMLLSHHNMHFRTHLYRYNQYLGNGRKSSIHTIIPDYSLNLKKRNI
jgi:Leucine-rich repeat (LRR) protein